MEDIKKSELTTGMMEAPFYRQGMKTDEWEKENKYLCENMDKLKNGTYMPLWKQKNN